MRRAPVAIIILDGFGWRDDAYGNAVRQAKKPHFDRYWSMYPHSTMRASGLAVGLPEGQMGNSEVGHTNIGAGRVVYQSITRIDQAITEGELDTNQAYVEAIAHAKAHGSALHLMGLVSEGGVHSHVRHLYRLLEIAKAGGLEKVYVHAFTDGRDVAPDSGLASIRALTTFFDDTNSGELATIVGRFYAMDRDTRWERVQQAYDALVHRTGAHTEDPLAALQEQYDSGVYDEFVTPIILNKDGKPLPGVQSDDSVVFFNFRPDRAIQLSKAFTEPDFVAFDRGETPQDLFFATMTQYTPTLDAHVMFAPIQLQNVLGEVLSTHGLTQLRIAETEKYPHVTFFMNGGRTDEFKGEDRILIPSPHVETYDLKPEMSAYEVGDALVDAIQSDTYDSIILNFANPDMVGHSGKLTPTIQAIEAVDDNLGRVVDALLERGGTALIFADHGNADTLLTPQGDAHTAHTTEPVPVIVTKKGVTLRTDGVLADIAPTMLELLGVPKPEEMTGRSLIAHQTEKRGV